MQILLICEVAKIIST